MHVSAHRDRERTAEGLGPLHRHPPARDERQLGEVAKKPGVAVGDPPDRRLLTGLERIERAELRSVDVQGRIRNRVAVRVVRREAERLVDPRLELLGQDVLEPVGFRVHGVYSYPERLGEVLLEEAMVADDLERDLLPALGELDATVRRMIRESEDGELLQHRGRRRRSDRHALRDRRRGRPLAAYLKLVDLLQVVLDRLAQRGLRHVPILVRLRSC